MVGGWTTDQITLWAMSISYLQAQKAEMMLAATGGGKKVKLAEPVLKEIKEFLSPTPEVERRMKNDAILLSAPFFTDD